MEKPELLKKLETILDDAERRQMYGSIEIQIHRGKATVIRKTETDRLDNGEQTHAKQNRY
jgi:hypothetical protein